MYTELLKAAIEMILQLFSFRAKQDVARDAMRVQLERVVKMYDAMSMLSSLKDIHRVSVLKIENSGGLIDPKVQLYVSVLHEDYSYPLTSEKSKYNKLPIDQVYVRMLHSLIQNNVAHVSTETMEVGLLKTLYSAAGIKAADVFYLGSDPKAVYVLSISSASSKEVFGTDEYKINATIAVDQIKKLLWNKSPN
jgi:hypothetical protein